MSLNDKLREVVGASACIEDADLLQPFVTEWRNAYHGQAALLVQPRSTDEVAQVVRLCREAGVAVVPQGGNTGLCAGAIPDQSGEQVLVSLSRMNKVRDLSADNFSMVVEAGCVLANVQQRAAEHGRYFPLSLAAEGSCQIGGNLSTNAGGTNVLRYGTAREQVLGLEVVLPDGSVWHGLRALRKDTAGYDIKQLFIGAEGTLGIITAANLKLFPQPMNLCTAFVAIDGPKAAVALLTELRNAQENQLQAFELIPARAMRYVQRHLPGMRVPFDQEYPWYVLLEASACGGEEAFQHALMHCIDRRLALDVVIARDLSDAGEFWRLRHAISEAQKLEGGSLKHDISVPVSAVGEFVIEAEQAVMAYLPEARVVAFGHVGDGNVHFNISQPRSWSAEDFLAEAEALATIVYDIVAAFDGSISAEHGIGVAKRGYLARYRSATELDLMRALKSALDPANTMNPGKVV